MKRLLVIAVLAALAGCAQQGAVEQVADIVLTGGRIYTVNQAQPWAEAVAIEGKDIVFVGSADEAAAFIGDHTEVVDVGGRLILPGIIDTHCHLRIAGQANSVMLNLFPYLKEKPDVVKEIIRKHAATLAPDEWVLGTGWGAGQFPNPTKEELDELVGGRRAILSDDSQHNGWYSSKALEHFGIDRDTPNPAGGIIKKGPDGEPSGHLVEKAHIVTGFAQVPRLFSKDQQETAVKTGIKLINEQGVTAIIEAAAITQDGGDDVYKRVYEKGEMNVRVSVNSVHLSAVDDEENEKVLKDRAFEGDEMLNLRTVKWAIDGIPGSMAFMKEPYLDGTHPPANYTQDRLNQEVDKYTEMGRRMMFHAEGDGGIDRTLTAMEYANATGKPLDPDARHIITHLDHGSKSDFARMKKLNIIAQIQPHWASASDYNISSVFPNLKPELIGEMYDFRGMLDAGLHVAAGADWPTSPEWTPWQMMEVGITRKAPNGTGERFNGEALTIEELIRMFTIEGAFTMFREDIIGSIETGKRADIIVLDRDIFELAKSNPDDLDNTKVLLTLLNGDPVWGGTNFNKVSPSGTDTFEYGDYVDGHVCEFGVWVVKEDEH